MDGKVYDGPFWHSQALPFVMSSRPQDACHGSVVRESYRPSDIRAQALDELLNDLREYAAASPAFRPYWRKLAMHDIARFKRDWLEPERAAFEGAVARSRHRRAA